MVVCFGVLTMGATNLDVVLISNRLESLLVLSKIGKVDMNRGAKSCAEVRRARGDVAEVIIVSEFRDLFDGASGVTESLEDSENIGTRLHRDDAELVLLVNPGEEGLFSVVENTTTLRPVTIQVASLEETVSFLEKEMVLDKLLSLSIGHFSQLVVLAS
jgi:hypothetical protein